MCSSALLKSIILIISRINEVYVFSINKNLKRGSYISADVLLNLLNELGISDNMRGLSSILSLFRNEFNKFNNTGA